jgi:rubrerythrin
MGAAAKAEKSEQAAAPAARPAPGGFTLDEAVRLASRGGAPGAANADADLFGRIGRNFAMGVLERASDLAAQGGGGPAVDPIGRADQVIDLVKKVRELGGEGDDLDRRIRKAVRAAIGDDDDDAPRGRRRGGESDLVGMMKVFADLQGKSEERVLKLLERMDEGMRSLIKEMREELRGKNPGASDDKLTQLAFQAMEEKLKSDPLQGYMAMRDHFREEFRGERRETAEEKVANAKAEALLLEAKAKIKEAENQQERDERGMAVVTELIASRRDGRRPAAGGGAPRYQYNCPECGATWELTRRLTTVTCPGCGAELATADAPEAEPGPQADA